MRTLRIGSQPPLAHLEAVSFHSVGLLFLLSLLRDRWLISLPPHFPPAGFDLLHLDKMKTFLQTVHAELAQSSKHGRPHIDVLFGNAGFVPVGNVTTHYGWEVPLEQHST